MLVDSHCHLNFPDFKDDLEEVITNAQENDVGIMQTICTKISEFPEILEIAETYDNIYCSVGVHPHEADKETVSIEELVNFTNNPNVIGIGETGLDYYYENSPKQIQQKSFLKHIEASRKTGLPIIVHSRSADADMAAILESETGKGRFPGLMHCFSSSLELAEKALGLGFYISISGIVTFKKAEDLRKIVEQIPLDKLLVETDSPFLAPVPHRGKRNEPAYTRDTAKYIAELKNLPYEEIATVTTANFYKLFAKVSNT